MGYRWWYLWTFAQARSCFWRYVPHSTDTMHQANEFVEVNDLYKAAAIYAEAIYELIK